MATQLRRYEVEPDRLDDLANSFSNIVKVREKYGFTSPVTKMHLSMVDSAI